MSDISRGDVATLIQEQFSGEILKAATAGSTVLSALPTLSMGTKVTHMPVLATLPTASWVIKSDDSAEGVKPTTEVKWRNKTLVAEELATIVPVDEDVLDDITGDILTQIAVMAGQAIGKALDQAILFGVNKPASWTSKDLLAAAVAAGQTTQIVGGKANEADLWGALNTSAQQIASAGFNPAALIAPLRLRFDLANLRDGEGRPAFNGQALAGFGAVSFNQNGAWDPESALALVVDPSMIRIGVRKDVTVKFLDQATVGGVSLAENDMVGLRFKARYAYVLGDVTTPAGTNQTPVAAVIPAAIPDGA